MPDSGQLTQTAAIPFDADLLDRLMEAAGIDVLLATSKHNVQYLLGGHRSLFFDYMDATGLSRYLPVVIYPKGGRDKAAYIGHRLEKFQTEVSPFWTSSTETTTNGSLDAMEKAIAYLRRAGIATRNIGVELPFLPADAAMSLRGAFPEANVKDAVVVLERLRARKRPDELAMLREASERVVQSMLAVMTKHAPGATKRELTEALRREEVSRGHELRVLPDHGRHQPQPRAFRRALGQGRHPLARTRAATITATSATCAAWPSTASRMPSWSTCWPRSRPSSAPP